jgi:hypothetical protein
LSFGSALPSFSDTCTFTTALPATVLTGWSGQSVTQPITWTLTA